MMKKLFFAVTTFILCITLLGGCSVANATADNKETKFPVIPKKLLSLRFEDYETMSISEYRTKAFDIIAQDEANYLSLIESVSVDKQIQDMRYTNEDAYFVTTVLIPTIAEKWNTWRFNNSITNEYFIAEYSICYTILNADNVTIGERNQAICSIMDSIQETLQTTSTEQLTDETGIQATLDIKIEELIEQYTTDSFKIEVDLIYRAEAIPSSAPIVKQTTMEERGEIGTETDYQLLLSLKTDGYKEMPVSEFFKSYVELAQSSEFGDVYERVSKDIANNDVHINMTEEEMDFLKVTLEATSQEFIAKYQNKNGVPTLQHRIEKQINKPVKGQDISIFEIFIDYEVRYSVLDDAKLKIGERDTILSDVKNSIEYFIDNRTIDELINGQLVFEKEIKRLEQQYSNSKIQLSISMISYQAFDQRGDIQSLQ